MKAIKVLNTKIAAISTLEMKSLVRDFLKNTDNIDSRRSLSAGEIPAFAGMTEVGGNDKGRNTAKQIGKVNTEFLLRALKNKEFCDALDGCHINIADGKGVLWAAKYLSLPLKARKLRIANCELLITIKAIWQMIYSGASLVFYPKYCKNPICENIPGLNAMYLMLEATDDTSSPVYFFGAEKDVLAKAIDKIKKEFPKLKIAGYHHGFGYTDEEIIGDINQSKAKLLIVALGSPKQEYWIRDNLDKLETVRVAVGEGGSLDFVAGHSKRAPRWMQSIGLEWFWRLFANRNRSAGTRGRAKRVWNAVPVFVYNVVKWKLEKQEIKS